MMTSDLITRLSKLDAPDREVDARIWCEVNGFRYCDHYPLDRETQVFFKEKGKRTEKVSGGSFPHAPAYTASVDAAIALAERVLQGKGIDLLREAISELGKKYDWHICLKKPEQAKELPIQVCIALLRAKEASKP